MVYHGIFSSLLLYGSQICRQSNQPVTKMEILKLGDSIKLSNFLYAHDYSKGNLPTTWCAGVTLLDSKHSQITRNQKGNQVNIPTVRTKTSG